MAHMARELDYDFEIVNAIIAVNQRQRERMVTKIENAIGDLAGKTIAFLGLTFKPNTDDIREAPAIFIIQELVKKGARIKAFDPAGVDNAKEVLPDIEYTGDAYGTMENADGLVITTEWNQFRNLDWDRIKGLLKNPVVVDLRNIYEPDRMKELGFRYSTVGR
jgi:UDPglucose 6-dehydrogenase